MIVFSKDTLRITVFLPQSMSRFSSYTPLFDSIPIKQNGIETHKAHYELTYLVRNDFLKSKKTSLWAASHAVLGLMSLAQCSQGYQGSFKLNVDGEPLTLSSKYTFKCCPFTLKVESLLLWQRCQKTSLQFCIS